MKLNKFTVLVMAIISVVSLSCGDDDSETPQNPNLIDTSGGTVTSVNNDLTINIPAGALSAPTEITVVETTAHPTGNIGVVYDLGPDGTKFNSPVSLTFDYDPTEIPTGGDENDLVIAFAESGNWIPLSSNTVNTSNNTVTATTDHFTPFTVFLPTSGGIEGEPPTQLFYNPDSYPFVPNQAYETPGASAVGSGSLVFSISNVDPDFTSQNFTINSENGRISLTNLTNDADEIKLDVTVANDDGSFTTQDAMTFNLATLNYTPEKDALFPGTIFDSGLPESNNIPENYEFFLTNLPTELEGSELAIDTQTGQVTGTINENVAPGTYQLEVTSANRDNWSLLFPNVITFDVVDPPADIAYPPAMTTLTASETFDSGMPTLSGEAPFTFELGQIADGLGSTQFNMDASSGQFTGTIANDAVTGTYLFDVIVSNRGGEVVFEEAVSFTLEEADVTLPTNISYDVSGDFFTYTGGETTRIDIVEGSNNQLTYSLVVFPSISTGIDIDENGNILINDGLVNANGRGYYTLSVTASNGTEEETFEEVVIIRAYNSFDPYTLEYDPRFSQISAFNPEVLTATTNAQVNPMDNSTLTIEKVYDQFGTDRTAELTQQNILTIANNGNLTFDGTGQQIISDNFLYFYVDVRVNGQSGNLVYRAVAVFGPE